MSCAQQPIQIAQCAIRKKQSLQLLSPCISADTVWGLCWYNTYICICIFVQAHEIPENFSSFQESLKEGLTDISPSSRGGASAFSNSSGKLCGSVGTQPGAWDSDLLRSRSRGSQMPWGSDPFGLRLSGIQTAWRSLLLRLLCRMWLLWHCDGSRIQLSLILQRVGSSNWIFSAALLPWIGAAHAPLSEGPH